MNKVLSPSSEGTKPANQRRRKARSVNPVYPVLLGLVLVVGASSLVAWAYGEFCLESRASHGDGQAQYLLGKRYFDSAMSPKDYQRAARLIRKSAQQGYARAEAGLGLMYENGLGVPKNYGESMKWLVRAADQGLAVAQNEIGVMYAKGRGVKRDLAMAVKWCRLAAEQGSEVARRNLQLAQVACARVIPDLTTPDKRSYKAVMLQKVESDGVTVSFSPVRGGMGVAKLKLENLPGELQELCKYATKEGADRDSAYSRMGAISTTTL